MVNLDQYVIGSGIIILIVAWMIGPGGAGPTLVPEKDVGLNGTDFNTSRLSFQPEMPKPPTYDTEALIQEDIIKNSSIEFNNSRLYWDGTTSDEGKKEGYIEFNVSDRNDKLALEVNDASGFFETPSILINITSSYGNSVQLSGLSESEIIDLSGTEYNLRDTEKLEIKINDVESWVDVSGKDVTAETGFFNTIIDLIQFGYNATVKIFGLLVAYTEFALILPGGIGYIALGFMGLLISYILLKHAWIG